MMRDINNMLQALAEAPSIHVPPTLSSMRTEASEIVVALPGEISLHFNQDTEILRRVDTFLYGYVVLRHTMKTVLVTKPDGTNMALKIALYSPHQ